MEHRDPRVHHETRLAERRRTEAQLAVADRRFSYARLFAVAAIAILGWASYWQGAVSAWWLVIPLLVLVILMRVHDRVIRTHERASRAVRWFERGLARLENRWAGSGETGTRFLDDHHPYSRDLDVFGEGSLFQLLSTAQTAAGEETLAGWLLGGADQPTIRSRQEAVADLSTRPQLLEDLYTLGVDARAAIDQVSLIRWAMAPAILHRAWMQVGAAALAVGFVVSVAGWAASVLPGLVPVVVLLVNVTIGLALGRPVNRVLHGSSEPARELGVLAVVLDRLREESYNADRLRQLRTELQSARPNPVLAVRRLDRLIQMHDWQHNMFFAPIAASVLWGVQCATAVEAWRQRHGQSVERWLSAVGEFEALAAFAAFRFEHPAYPFPELVKRDGDTDPPIYDAQGIAHPFLADDRAVANDLSLGRAPQLVVLSGSNMSGKTTLLRTVGINGVLALAGAPVRAKSLRISPVSIGATLRVQDSLLEGKSRFYAEILRVKQLVEIARGAIPLLFLMDELFHGTNSHDRVEGAHGVLEYLVGLGGVGLVTTHDLALAEIGDRLGSQATNVHFEDQVVEGELRFDYRLRPGRSVHGNALALMRAVGLEVNTAGQTSPTTGD